MTTSRQSSSSTAATRLWGRGPRKGSKTPLSLHEMTEAKEGEAWIDAG